MAELGWFNGQRAELIGGEIVVLSPQNFAHASTTDRVAERLKLAFAESWVRMQLPLDTGQDSLPEPDVSVVRGSRESYSNHPRAQDAELVVEVSDTTLAFDRSRKVADYAAAGVREYWIVNIVQRQVEVHRAPIEDSSAAFGWRFDDVSIMKPGDMLVPLARLDQSIAVADLVR
ncbi:MAG TPA: Uma2 family endonuclease [Humisphaera sp.]|nr:Uma2 family endonuclease [Humisphaera sp.]